MFGFGGKKNESAENGKLSLNLEKGDGTLVQNGKLSLNLEKGDSDIKIQLSWDSPDDLDAMAFMGVKDKNNQVISRASQRVAWYDKRNEKRGTFASDCGALVHSGDALDGTEDDGIDEEIVFNPLKVPSEVSHIAIIVNNYSSKNFKRVKNPKLEIVKDGKILMSAKMSDKQFQNYKTIHIGNLYYENGVWNFEAVAEGTMENHNEIRRRFER